MQADRAVKEVTVALHTPGANYEEQRSVHRDKRIACAQHRVKKYDSFSGDLYLVFYLGHRTQEVSEGTNWK